MLQVNVTLELEMAKTGFSEVQQQLQRWYPLGNFTCSDDQLAKAAMTSANTEFQGLSNWSSGANLWKEAYTEQARRLSAKAVEDRS